MVLSGMSDMAQMQDNISYMKEFQPLSEQEMEAVGKVQEIFRSMNRVPCTSCRYCVAGCSKQIASMFDNRLEILSHGGLPSGMTKKQFFEGISKPRNITLMRIFLSMGLTEHTGHGIPTIVKKYGEEVFEIEDNYIRCTIPFDEEVLYKSKNENVGLNVGLNVALNKTEKKVVSLLIEDSEYTSDELAAKIGVTKRTIERAFISLQNKKVIERIGSKRDGSWIVIK